MLLLTFALSELVDLGLLGLVFLFHWGNSSHVAVSKWLEVELPRPWEGEIVCARWVISEQLSYLLGGSTGNCQHYITFDLQKRWFYTEYSNRACLFLHPSLLFSQALASVFPWPGGRLYCLNYQTYAYSPFLIIKDFQALGRMSKICSS